MIGIVVQCPSNWGAIAGYLPPPHPLVQRNISWSPTARQSVVWIKYSGMKIHQKCVRVQSIRNNTFSKNEWILAPTIRFERMCPNAALCCVVHSVSPWPTNDDHTTLSGSHRTNGKENVWLECEPTCNEGDGSYPALSETSRMDLSSKSTICTGNNSRYKSCDSISRIANNQTAPETMHIHQSVPMATNPIWRIQSPFLVCLVTEWWRIRYPKKEWFQLVHRKMHGIK